MKRAFRPARPESLTGLGLLPVMCALLIQCTRKIRMGTCFCRSRCVPPPLEIRRECATATRLGGGIRSISKQCHVCRLSPRRFGIDEASTEDNALFTWPGRSRRNPQPPISCSASSDLLGGMYFVHFPINDTNGQTESSRPVKSVSPFGPVRSSICFPSAA